MNVYIFGNPDLAMDALPVTLLPELQKKFPQHHFVFRDPLDEWDHVPDPLVICDTVVGIGEVKEFSSLDVFQTTPRVTMHDFDVYAQLQLMKKVGKLKNVRIIGIPPNIPAEQALQQLTRFFSD